MGMRKKLSKIKKMAGKGGLKVLKSMKRGKKIARRELGKPAKAGSKSDIEIFGSDKKSSKSTNFGINYGNKNKKSSSNDFGLSFGDKNKKKDDFDIGLDL